MTILGTIELSDDLVLDGMDNATQRATEVDRSLYGVSIYNSGVPLIGGRELSLGSVYHVTYAQLLQVQALEATGDAVTLSHTRGNLSVVVTGNDLTPDTQLADPQNATDLWYSGNIYLLEM